MVIPIEALLALWRESERKMYPLATTAPQKYEQVIRLARAIANELVGVTSSEELAQRWEHRSAVVQSAIAQVGIPLGDLPEFDVAGVAFVLRHNEVRAKEHHDHLVDLIAIARHEHRQWVVLHERGTLEQGLMDPYQAIELHLGSGIGLVSSVEQNPANGHANHVLTVIRMDPVTGAATDIEPGLIETRELADSTSFTTGRAEIRALIERY